MASTGSRPWASTRAHQCRRASALAPNPARPRHTHPTVCPPPCSWNAFYHDIDEDKVKQQADLMVSLGLRDAG